MVNLDRFHAITVSKTKAEYTPMFSAGMGHCYKIGVDSYFRLSIDAGYKSSPVNLNLSLVF
jgi:hypothetical protein